MLHTKTSNKVFDLNENIYKPIVNNWWSNWTVLSDRYKLICKKSCFCAAFKVCYNHQQARSLIDMLFFIEWEQLTVAFHKHLIVVFYEHWTVAFFKHLTVAFYEHLTSVLYIYLTVEFYEHLTVEFYEQSIVAFYQHLTVVFY